MKPRAPASALFAAPSLSTLQFEGCVQSPSLQDLQSARSHHQSSSSQGSRARRANAEQLQLTRRTALSRR
eukprot:CAMPEP_0204477408 /NCGR_PEP_ID=MMETSP0471-20130131/31851_1 /ASSEMBLY_ACC=CAM_ASM_000602 /TAXON_ID=2969 /ORGANISM="Oxyrrhis marina" /LENGTH=69 /DNA_ID=CAMNT_0051480133 /DNA_START=489 /DNA_END=695 /DNA_ORIENTATION=+